jgi:hypothetical protein
MLAPRAKCSIIVDKINIASLNLNIVLLEGMRKILLNLSSQSLNLTIVLLEGYIY